MNFRTSIHNKLMDNNNNKNEKKSMSALAETFLLSLFTNLPASLLFFPNGSQISKFLNYVFIYSTTFSFFILFIGSLVR